MPGNPDSRQPQTTRFVDSWASVLLDGLRGSAAILVLLGHWRDLFFLNYEKLPAHKLVFLVPYLISGAGHQAVVVFFVMSGYFIGGSVLGSVRRASWSWSDYLLRRGVRLWVVLIPALIFCTGWDLLGIHLGHAPGLYNGVVHHALVPNIPERLTPWVFLSNLFFLQTILTPAYGSDGALWSLANEFWYYMLFPLAFFALRKGAAFRERIICAILAVAVATLIYGEILVYFFIWMGGVAIYLAPPPKLAPKAAARLRLLATLIYFPIFFAIAKQTFVRIEVSDFTLGAFTTGYLWILLSARQPFKPGPAASIGRGAARFSYSLYALHFPFLIFATALMVGDSRWEPTLPHLLAAAVPLLLAAGYAYAVASGTEFQTDRIRARLEHLFRLRPLPAARPSGPIAPD